MAAAWCVGGSPRLGEGSVGPGRHGGEAEDIGNVHGRRRGHGRMDGRPEERAALAPQKSALRGVRGGHAGAGCRGDDRVRGVSRPHHSASGGLPRRRPDHDGVEGEGRRELHAQPGPRDQGQGPERGHLRRGRGHGLEGCRMVHGRRSQDARRPPHGHRVAGPGRAAASPGAVLHRRRPRGGRCPRHAPVRGAVEAGLRGRPGSYRPDVAAGWKPRHGDRRRAGEPTRPGSRQLQGGRLAPPPRRRLATRRHASSGASAKG